MGLFRRVNDLFTANLNDVVDRFEDPEKMLKQAIREMERGVDESMDAAARALASERLLRRQLGACRAEAEQWRERARAAVDEEHEDVARDFVGRAQEADRRADSLREELATASGLAERMRRQVEGFEEQLDEARRRLAALATRRNSAAALRRARSLHGTGTRQCRGFARFAAMRDRIDRAEAEAEAWIELGRLPVPDADAALAAEREEAVTEELARMRAASEE